jgi:hypothetical protein
MGTLVWPGNVTTFAMGPARETDVRVVDWPTLGLWPPCSPWKLPAGGEARGAMTHTDTRVRNSCVRGSHGFGPTGAALHEPPSDWEAVAPASWDVWLLPTASSQCSCCSA